MNLICLVKGVLKLIPWYNRHEFFTYISFTHKSNLIKARNSRLKSYLSRFYYRPSGKDGSQPRSKNLSARGDFAGFYLSSRGDGKWSECKFYLFHRSVRNNYVLVFNVLLHVVINVMNYIYDSVHKIFIFDKIKIELKIKNEK